MYIRPDMVPYRGSSGNEFLDSAKVKELKANPFPFYAVLLGRSSDKFLAKFIDENASMVHNTTGETCLLFNSYPITKIPPDLKNYWKENLSDKDYHELVEEGPNPDLSYSIAKVLKMKREKMPCIFITTSLEDKNGIYFKIPNWSEKNLSKLFDYLMDKLDKIAQLDDEERSQKLLNIGKYSRWKIGSLYIKNNWISWVTSENTPKIILGLLGLVKPS